MIKVSDQNRATVSVVFSQFQALQRRSPSGQGCFKSMFVLIILSHEDMQSLGTNWLCKLQLFNLIIRPKPTQDCRVNSC